MAVPYIVRGEYTGNGEGSQNISIGFVPEVLFLMNKTDGSPVVMWTGDFDDGASLDIGAAAASNAAGSVAPFAGTAAGVPQGFTTGADNNVNNKVYAWVAFRANY